MIDLPWTEKYRPKSLSDVIGQRLVVERLRSFVERGNFPNMIFAGSPGIGKTACGQCWETVIRQDEQIAVRVQDAPAYPAGRADPALISGPDPEWRRELAASRAKLLAPGALLARLGQSLAGR